MNIKLCSLILILIFVKSSKSDENSCKIRRDVLKNELEILQKTFNIANSDPAPSKCSEYQNTFVQIINGINFEDVSDKEQNPAYQKLKTKYLTDEQELQADYESKRRRLEDQYTGKRQEIDTNARNTIEQTKQIRRELAEFTKKHNLLIEKFNKCDDGQNAVMRMQAYKPIRRFGAAPATPSLCLITHEWFNNLKTIVDSKIYTSNDFNITGDCILERKWFLGLNDILIEAKLKTQSNFNIETYKIMFEKLLKDKKKSLDDSNFELSQEHQRSLKAAMDQLQVLNSEMQKFKENMIELKAQQKTDLEQLGLKLIGCNHFNLALQLVDEVESKTFLREILTKEYQMSSNEEKADQMLTFLGQIQVVCKRFEALVILYDVMKSSSHMESPTMIEIIEQIKNSMFEAKDCGIEYDQSSFLSKTLAEDPTIDKILEILSDNIKVGSFDKIVTFNYYHPITFGQILPTLVKKSYTGPNLDILLKFKDNLYWLLHKYDVLDNLLSLIPPKTVEQKKMFKESVEMTMKTESRYHEHDTRLTTLKKKMIQNGIKIND